MIISDSNISDYLSDSSLYGLGEDLTSHESGDRIMSGRVFDNRTTVLSSETEDAERQSWVPIVDLELRQENTQNMDKLRHILDSPESSDVEKYLAVSDVCEWVFSQFAKSHNDGFDIVPYAAVYNVLSEHKDTDKILIRRMISSVIDVLPLVIGIAWYDSGLNAEEQDEIDANGGQFTEGTVIKFNAQADAIISENPECQLLLNYSREVYGKKRFEPDYNEWLLGGEDDPYVAEARWSLDGLQALSQEKDYSTDSRAIDRGDYTSWQTPDDPIVVAHEDEKIRYPEEIEAEINGLFGVSIFRLSYNVRSVVFPFCTSLTESTFNRIRTVSQSFANYGGRLNFANAFLSTEFGDDFGNTILDIAEHVSSEKTLEICELVNSLRTKSHEYADIFASIDPVLAEQTEKALSERITDLLVSLQTVAASGSLNENVSPARNTPGQESVRDFNIEVRSVDEAIDILASLEKTFATQQAIITADDLRINRVNNDVSQFTLYRFVSETAGNMLLYIRPEGGYGYDPTVEYGNRAGVEASISFVVDPHNPHALLLPKSSEGVSIRFDREGRTTSEAPNSPDRDPTREDGMMSIDVSSIMGPETSVPVRIGRFVAAGNFIRSRNEGTADSLHHNSNYFDQEKYGSAEGFAKLAEGIAGQIEILRSDANRRKLSVGAMARAL